MKTGPQAEMQGFEMRTWSSLVFSQSEVYKIFAKQF